MTGAERSGIDSNRDEKSRKERKCEICGKEVEEYVCVLNKPACKHCEEQIRTEYEEAVLERVQDSPHDYLGVEL